MPTLSDPVAFTLLGLTIRWYALFILAGIVAAIWLIGVLAARRGFDPDFLLDIAPWVVVGSIAGARLTYVLLKWDYYGDHLGQAINVRLGGLSIHGATITGIALVIWFCRQRGQRFLAWADPMIAGLALGQAIGRWGNWANQEAFGTPTGLPWAVSIDPPRRPAAYADATTFHPTFLYESLFNLGNAALLAWVTLRIGRGRPFREGDALWLYLITYGIGRFTIESIRTDSVYVGAYPGAYWASAAFVAVGAAVLLWRHRPGATGATGATGAMEDTGQRHEKIGSTLGDTPAPAVVVRGSSDPREGTGRLDTTPTADHRAPVTSDQTPTVTNQTLASVDRMATVMKQTSPLADRAEGLTGEVAASDQASPGPEQGIGGGDRFPGWTAPGTDDAGTGTADLSAGSRDPIRDEPMQPWGQTAPLHDGTAPSLGLATPRQAGQDIRLADLTAPLPMRPDPGATEPDHDCHTRPVRP